MPDLTPTLWSHFNYKNLRTFFTNPGYSWRRGAKLLYESRHPQDPWIAPSVVKFLNSFLRPEHTVLEWGSGRSTLWFASRVRRVISIEHDGVWRDEVLGRIDAARLKERVDLRLRSAVGGEASDYILEVARAEPNSIDVTLIDGVLRHECVQVALPLVRPGGLLVVDNSDRAPMETWGVPAHWRCVLVGDFYGEQTAVWSRP